MINSKLLFFILFLFLSSCQNGSNTKESNTRIQHQDIHLLIGEWTGSLTYIDYRTNKPYEMPANLIVEKGRNKDELFLKNIYPNETSANNIDTLIITNDGSFINNQPVVSRDILDGGVIRIITEQQGKDNNKVANLKHIYLIGKNNYSDTKEVQFQDSKAWLKRSVFSYKRKE